MKLSRRARGGPWWIDYYDEHGQRRRASTRCRDRAAAEQIAAKVRRGVELRRAGLDVPDKLAAERPIDELVERWLADKPDACAQHRATLRGRVLRAVRDRAWRHARDITAESVHLHLDALTRPATGGTRVRVSLITRNQVRSALHDFCRWCCIQRPPMLVVNPVEHVAKRAERREPKRWPLTEHEALALLHAPPPEDGRGSGWAERRVAYHLALEAGLRRGECRALRVRHVRLEGLRPFLALPATGTKSGRSETVPMTERLRGVLEPWVRGKPPDEPVLRRMPQVSTLRRDLARVGVCADQGGGRLVDFHTLRHTFAARLGRRGVHPQAARELMRHRDISTTMHIYGQCGVLEGADAVRRLDAL